MTAIHRYEIPVDDAWHTLFLKGGIVHVAARREDIVEVWASTGGLGHHRTFRVFGTGQELPEQDSSTKPVHRGSAITPSGRLVWHLLELLGIDGAAHPGGLDGGVIG